MGEDKRDGGEASSPGTPSPRPTSAEEGEGDHRLGGGERRGVFLSFEAATSALPPPPLPSNPDRGGAGGRDDDHRDGDNDDEEGVVPHTLEPSHSTAEDFDVTGHPFSFEGDASGDGEGEEVSGEDAHPSPPFAVTFISTATTSEVGDDDNRYGGEDESCVSSSGGKIPQKLEVGGSNANGRWSQSLSQTNNKPKPHGANGPQEDENSFCDAPSAVINDCSTIVTIPPYQRLPSPQDGSEGGGNDSGLAINDSTWAPLPDSGSLSPMDDLSADGGHGFLPRPMATIPGAYRIHGIGRSHDGSLDDGAEDDDEAEEPGTLTVEGFLVGNTSQGTIEGSNDDHGRGQDEEQDYERLQRMIDEALLVDATNTGQSRASRRIFNTSRRVWVSLSVLLGWEGLGLLFLCCLRTAKKSMKAFQNMTSRPTKHRHQHQSPPSGTTETKLRAPFYLFLAARGSMSLRLNILQMLGFFPTAMILGGLLT